ncbi:hypothetical protein BDZ97DRAFT_1790890 [Flammula alnicola]|nr:hypothetical protein BDZ97DRAFT_1790890 [Flammula alnicola]
MPEQITLYTAKAEITLEESKLPYKRYEIDLKKNQSGMRLKSIPRASIAYGGPDVPPDSPSPESQKIAESGVLIELFADLSNEDLLPKDPIARAKARFFIETVTPQFADPEGILKVVETIQNLLPPEGYAVGQWSIADAAVTPFFARAEVSLTNDIGLYEEGKGKATWAKLESDPKYARFRNTSLISRTGINVIVDTFSKLYVRPTVQAAA